MAKKALEGMGIWVRGEIRGRRRREVSLKDGGKRYVISLRVDTGEEMIMLDRWADTKLPSDIPEVGSQIELPIRIRTFSTKTGVAKTSFEWGPAQEDTEF